MRLGNAALIELSRLVADELRRRPSRALDDAARQLATLAARRGLQRVLADLEDALSRIGNTS